MLKSYEILRCEPLHDIKGHITNIYEEIVYHASNEKERSLLKNLIQQSLENKACKRGVDYRASLIKAVIWLKNKINDDLYDILETLCEIQELLYTSVENRTVEKILRLDNQTFLHMMLLKRVVKRNPLSPKMSSKKFYGKYLHAIVAHGPLMLRIISGISANSEQEERTFNTLKTTSNIKLPPRSCCA